MLGLPGVPSEWPAGPAPALGCHACCVCVCVSELRNVCWRGERGSEAYVCNFFSFVYVIFCDVFAFWRVWIFRDLKSDELSLGPEIYGSTDTTFVSCFFCSFQTNDFLQVQSRGRISGYYKYLSLVPVCVCELPTAIAHVHTCRGRPSFSSLASMHTHTRTQDPTPT